MLTIISKNLPPLLNVLISRPSQVGKLVHDLLSYDIGGHALGRTSRPNVVSNLRAGELTCNLGDRVYCLHSVATDGPADVGHMALSFLVADVGSVKVWLGDKGIFACWAGGEKGGDGCLYSGRCL